MAYGIRIYNQASGSIQIDENYKNLCLTAKVSGNITTTTAGGFSGGSSYADITMSSSIPNPVIAIGDCAYFAQTGNHTVSGGTRTVRISFAVNGSTFPFTYYIFSPVPDVSAYTGQGVRVWNPATGKLTFDSNYRYMKMAGMYFSKDIRSPGWTAWPNETYTLASGKNYAYIHEASGQTTAPTIVQSTVSSCRLNGNTLYTGRNWNNGGYLVGINDGQILVVDVTNY